jgi:hypothetical protein
MANYLGTLGSLISLVRESVGAIGFTHAIKKSHWPQERSIDIISHGLPIDKVLPFSKFSLTDKQALAFKNGAFFDPEKLSLVDQTSLSEKYFWVLDNENKLIGLGEKSFPQEFRPKINFHSEEKVSPSSDHDL